MPSKNWKITNSNTKNISVVLIDAYPDTDQVLPAAFFYEQQLSLLLTDSDSSVITSGSTNNEGTFIIPAAHVDANGTTVPYTFIIANAATLAPVTSVTCRVDALPNLADLVITDDTLDNMGKAIDFVKNITAFPTSDLAIDFADMVKSGDNPAPFFQGTKDYKDVTLDDVLLVQTYYKALPYGWTNGEDTTYYLYSTGYRNNSDTDEPVGELKLSGDRSLPLDVRLNTRKFSISLTTHDDKKTTILIFKDGVFWDNPDTDTPKTALVASFIMPSQLTMENSRNDIEAYLVGKLNGFDAFGLGEKAPHDQDDDGGFLDVLSVHNFKEGLDLAMYFITIGMGIGFLVSCYYAAKYLKNKFTSDDALETIKKAQEIKDFITANNEILATRIGGAAAQRPNPAQVRENQQAARAQMLDRATRQAKVNIQQMVDQQWAGYKAISNKVVNEDILNAQDGLTRIQTNLDQNTLADFREHIAEMRTILTNSNVTLIANKTDINRRLNGDERRAFDEAREIYDRVSALQDATAREINDLQEGRDQREIEEEFVDIVQ